MSSVMRVERKEKSEIKFVKIKVTRDDKEELDWYIVSFCGLGA